MKKIRNISKDTLWIIATLILIFIPFFIFASVTIYLDPFFHYHAPLKNYEYFLNNQRYQNDGIIRHFEYDSIITGTSMTENFMTSEADQIYDADFIKTPYSGGLYKEINSCIQKAYDSGKELKYVIRCLDYTMLIKDKNEYRHDAQYPTYLYNENLFDDVNYILNKSVFFDYDLGIIDYTRNGNKTTSFDTYSNWSKKYTYGAESVLASYTLNEPQQPQKLTRKEQRLVIGNIRQNVTDLANEHPETTFYIFFPPYSIGYWDMAKNNGTMNKIISAERLAIKELLKCPNIKPYSFCNNFELVCNLDNYKDDVHYGEWINSQILEWMHKGEYLLTEDNYQKYIKTKRKFYNSYDYHSLHED